MPVRTIRVATSSLITMGMLTCTAAFSPAFAGFEWTPPPAQEKAAPSAAANGPLTPEMESLPMAPVAPVDQAPVETQPSPEPQQAQIPAAAPDHDYLPVPVGKTAEPEILSNTPSQQLAEPTPQPAANAQPVPQAATPEQSDAISGFGSDIPLALALRDIVPAAYPYAFEKSTYAGVRISWNGGLPWIKVLENSLAPVGLKATLTGTTLYISAATTTVLEPVMEQSPQPVPTPAPEEPMKLSTAEPAPANTAASELQQTPAPNQTPPTHVAGDIATQREWKARPGSTLRQTLETWSSAAHVELEWMSPYDFPIANSYNYVGTFKEAAESLLSSFGRESPKPRGRFFPNEPDGPSVLMVN